MANYFIGRNLFSSLVSRLLLTGERNPGVPGLALSDLVLPTMDITEQLLVTLAKADSFTVTATGVKLCFAVPVGERWYVRSFRASQNTGTFTMDGMGAQIDTINVYFNTWASVGGDHFYNLPFPLPLKAGDFLMVDVDTFAVNGTLAFSVLYQRMLLS